MDEIEEIKSTLSHHGYEYKDFIGKGGFSSVLLCQSAKYHQIFAVKRSIKHHLTQNEYNNMISLNHPNIISLYNAFTDEKCQYLIMEYCSNGTMKDKRNLPYDKFVYYSKQILQAVAYCHSKKISHRDIKPENIFLDQYDHVKLADFGMAKKFEDNEKSSEKCGSLMFAPPEMLQYTDICPFKADIWALGITFFMMATGEYPFPHTTKDELKLLIFNAELNFDSYDIHPKIRYLIGRMTIKDPNHRPSAKKLLELPIFANTSSMRISLTGHREHSSMNLNTNQILKISDKPPDDKNKTAKTGILSYRSLNFHQKKVLRINGRIQPVKTF